MNNLPEGLIGDKNGLIYLYFDKTTECKGFTQEKGTINLKIGLNSLMAVRHVQEIRTQELTVLRYINKLKNKKRFIETGSDRGQMVEFVKDEFDKVYSIEINKERYSYTKNKFKNYRHIHIMHGDSGKLIPREADLYWLDAHMAPLAPKDSPSSYHRTGVCPLMDELNRIDKFEYILIDDVSMMTGTHTFPKLKEIFEFADKKWNAICKVENSIIVIENDKL